MMKTIHTLITDHIDIWTAAETEKKSGRGRSSGNAGNVYGIKKLRELILELAVRGKLVPQDANDEPASELLKRIQAEKAKLIAEGKRKSPLTPLLQRGESKATAANSNTTSPPLVKGGPGGISENEMPFELPPGWEWAKFGAIYSLEYGDNLPSEKRSNSGEYPVYGSNGVVGSHNLCFVSSPCIVVGRKGSAGALNLSSSTGCCVTDVAYYCIPPKCLNLDFSFKLFHTLGLDGLGKGIKPGLNRNEAYELPIPIPPLAEQHRIVDKVDELMTLCDQLETQHSNAAEAHEKLVNHLLGMLTQSPTTASPLCKRGGGGDLDWQRIAEHFDTLFTTEASIDALKQTLLQLAVMGKLVPQDPNDEPASELLKCIQTEKAKLVAEGKIKKSKQLPPITDPEMPFDLQEGWEWIRVSDIAELTTSGSRDWAQYLSDEGAKFITMGNLSRGSYKLRLENMRYVNPPKTGEGSRTKLEANDLLISITGDVGNLGRIPENFGEAYINQHTCLLRFLPQCRNRYFPEAMRSPMASLQFNAPQRGIKNSFA